MQAATEFLKGTNSIKLVNKPKVGLYLNLMTVHRANCPNVSTWEFGRRIREMDPWLEESTKSPKTAYVKVKRLFTRRQKADHNETVLYGTKSTSTENLARLKTVSTQTCTSTKKAHLPNKDRKIFRSIKRQNSRLKTRVDLLKAKYRKLQVAHTSICRENEKLLKLVNKASRKLQLATNASQKKVKMVQNQRRKSLKRKNKAVNRLKSNIMSLQKNLQSSKQQVYTLGDINSHLKKQNKNIFFEMNKLEEKIEEEQAHVEELANHNAATTSSGPINTKDGKTYSTKIRTLYYTLLAERLPPAKIENIIKTVLKSFCPQIEVDTMQLPKKSMAANMRKKELPTIAIAHNAKSIAEQKDQGIHLNTDGTTLNQRKLNAYLGNGMVLGVEEVVDGSASASLEELSRILLKIKEVGIALQIDGAEAIDTNLIKSVMSDQASSQKKFNNLLQGQTKSPLIQAFCGMHLGVNLQAAATKATKKIRKEHIEANKDAKTSSSPGDTLVYAVCKLLGHLDSSPEYGHGVEKFPEYVETLLHDAKELEDIQDEKIQELSGVLGTKFDRQVGNRYFVTTHNAGKVLFIAPTAIKYLTELKSMKQLNALESEVLMRLQDPFEIAELQLQGLLFSNIYADLMCLLKSTKLNKKLLDMNYHYLELQRFLEKIHTAPRLLLDCSLKCFPSEVALHGSDPTLNHRLHKRSLILHERLHKVPEDHINAILTPLIKAVSNEMLQKLLQYRADQLPGGRL